MASAQNSNSLGCVLLATATGRREQTDRHIRKTDSVCIENLHIFEINHNLHDIVNDSSTLGHTLALFFFTG